MGLAVSGNGRFVAFVSAATNLVPRDTNMKRDVFVYDLQTGVTERVSVSSAGVQATQDSFGPRLSADGRLVVFSTSAPNLVPGDTVAGDVFLHDRVTHTTTRISLTSSGGQANGYSGSPAISPDGRFVAFASDASNLAAGDMNGWSDIYLKDRLTGSVKRMSVPIAAAQGDLGAAAPSVSTNGDRVAYYSYAPNLVPRDTNAQPDVFVRRITSAVLRVSGAPVAGGSATGGGTFARNTSHTVKATAKSGYRFVRWTERGVERSTSPAYAFTLTADRTLVAVFARIP